jgi:hypothetical protein
MDIDFNMTIFTQTSVQCFIFLFIKKLHRRGFLYGKDVKKRQSPPELVNHGVCSDTSRMPPREDRDNSKSIPSERQFKRI